MSTVNPSQVEIQTISESSTQSTGGWIVGIVIFLLLFLFIGVIAFAILLTDRTNPIPATATISGNFLAACDSITCGNGLACDPISTICKGGTGFTCSDAADCISTLFCSGVCVNGPIGNLNQYCPCNGPNYTCEPDSCNPTSGVNVCKAIGGVPCTQNCDCRSTICNPDGLCAAGAPDAYPCLTDDTCNSNFCSQGYCQPVGVTTGLLGSYCATSDAVSTPFCGVSGLSTDNPGAGCNAIPGTFLACTCVNGIGQPGVCVNSSRGLMDNCSFPASGCVDQLICLASGGVSCSSGTTGCICSFPYTDPNVPTSTSTHCIDGMTLTSGECRNNSGLGCSVDSACVNSCGGPSVMAIYTFDNVDGVGGVTWPWIMPGAQDTGIMEAFPGPIGSSPYKLFGFSEDYVDTIYLVDSNLGLLVTTYDTQAKTSTGWISLLPHLITDTTQKTLIDATYNGNSFLVAFLETTGTESNYTVYLWDQTPYPNATLVPFNISGSGIPGTQYTSGGQAIPITYLSIAPFNQGLTGTANPPVASDGGQVLIMSTSSPILPGQIGVTGTVYVKDVTEITYTIGVVRGGQNNGMAMTTVVGPVQFYYDITQDTGVSGPAVCPENCVFNESTGESSNCPSNPINCPSFYNIAFGGNYRFPNGSITYQDILQFSGNVAGIAIPIDPLANGSIGVPYLVYDYSIYSPPMSRYLPGVNGATGITGSTGMNGSVITILAQTPTTSVVVLAYGGLTAIVPYQVDAFTRTVATANGFYVISPGSCS